KQYRTSILPSLYQSMGLLNFVKGDRAETKARLRKASELAPADPFNYMLLAQVLNDEYEDAAKQAKSNSEQMTQALGLMDQVIDAYAHFVALAEGNERLKEARQQLMSDLESYYKFRHKGSTEGLQQLIDKYKVTAKP